MSRIHTLVSLAGIVTTALLAFPLTSLAQDRPEVPEDLVDDEHIREEFGINHFTTPSIGKLFDDLDELGTLPYDKLKREIPKDTPRDRALMAMNLGTLIAEGFLIVQAEKVSELEAIGRAVLKQAKILGTGMRVTKHTKSILESSGLGEWDKLREELAKTQADVEAEMVMLRDVDIAHLVSLGGWVRALEIVAATASDPYNAKKAAKIQRTDTIRYFQESLHGLEPKLRKNANIQKVTESVGQIYTIVEKAEGAPLKEEDLQALLDKARALRKLIEGPKRS